MNAGPSLPRRTLRSAAVVGVVAAGYVGGVVTGVVGSQGDAPAPSSRGVIDEAADRIAASAARPVDRAELERAAVEGMLAATGDRWSGFFRPSEFSSFQDALEGRYAGVGLWLRPSRAGGVEIGSVQRRSPADVAGLLPGDRIAEVDGGDVRRATVAAVATAVRGQAGTAVVIRVHRAGGVRDVRLTRASFSTDAVTVERLRGDVVLLRVGSFSRGVGSVVRKALLDAPAEHAGGVVLDLRDNPGGLLDEAVEVASGLLDGGPVVSYQRRGEPVRTMAALGRGDTTAPVVVLVNGGTASAAEVVAGALQDRNRAVVVGSRTYGKGSVQEPTRLSDGSAIELTVGRYLTPSGRSLDGVGIEPDIAVPETASRAVAERRALQVLDGLLAALPAAHTSTVVRDRG